MSTRAEKVARARELREQGATYERIAADLGVGTTTVQRWVKPDFAARQRAASRAWKDAHREQNRERDRLRAADPDQRGRCEACGGLMGVGTRDDGVCDGCRASQAEARRERIAAMWTAGLSLAAIAADLGTSADCTHVEICRMRDDGWSLPYRRLGPRQPGKHPNLRPEQVAA